MIAPPDWTRRQFLARSASLAALSALSWRTTPTHAQARLSISAESLPELAGSQPHPLLEGHTARPLRYSPENRAFRIRNGSEFFNRPLYGPNSAFRIDAGDLPEFSLYLPGHGGNLRVGFARTSGSKWLYEAEEVVARYSSGQMLYSIRDPLLGKGLVELHLVTQAQGAGLHLAIHARETPPDLLLIWAFGGVSGRKGRHGGDLGCELAPVSRLFQLQPEECTKNSYKIRAASAELKSEAASLDLTFPPGSRLHVADAARWNDGWPALQQSSEDSVRPILAGSVALDASGGSDTPPIHILIRQSSTAAAPIGNPAVALEARTRRLTVLADTVRVTTPDPFVDAAAAALVHAADAIWDESQQCVLLGAVSSRTALPGWRGPYALDALGSHDHMRRHLRHWIARQNQTPLPASQDPDAPVTGPSDSESHLTRKKTLLHTNGDLSGNSYNMNLVFFDALVRHLRWTGDLDLTRELWPALVRHMDREYRTFRRAFPSPDPTSSAALPLYEAYACISASDNLQYNGGGATHATAYNYFFNRSAATIARILGEDPAPYEDEAALIHTAANQLLWMPEAGAFAESRDLLLPQTLQTSPALWTAYHAIDSEVPTPRQSWQIVTERLTSLRRIPVHGEGVPEGPWFLLPSSDWLPAASSLNQISLTENMHFALALWQAGLHDEAFSLFKGNLLDSMFQGLCPGNFHLTSQLDPYRGESQRDLADPIGITSPRPRRRPLRHRPRPPPRHPHHPPRLPLRLEPGRTPPPGHRPHLASRRPLRNPRDHQPPSASRRPHPHPPRPHHQRPHRPLERTRLSLCLRSRSHRRPTHHPHQLPRRHRLEDRHPLARPPTGTDTPTHHLPRRRHHTLTPRRHRHPDRRPAGLPPVRRRQHHRPPRPSSFPSTKAAAATGSPSPSKSCLEKRTP